MRDGIESASKTLSQGELTWFTKHVGRYNPVGQQLKRCKYWLDSKCPRCGQSNKDSIHIVMCLHTSSVEILADSALGLEIDLKSNGIHPFIIDALVMPVHDCGQTSFCENVLPRTSDTSDLLYHLICDAASEIDQIIFYSMFKGHISSKWTVTQDREDWEQLHCRKQGTLWEKRTITSLYWMTRTM